MPETEPVAARLRQILAHTGIDRAFLADEPIRALTLDGVAGLALAVRLTSYRALPLSCIGGVELCIDGTPVDLTDATLGLGGLFHRLDALGGLSTASWFILDIATLFVPRAQPLAQGAHRVSGTLCTIEPYITAGRFAFYNSATRDLVFEGGAA